MLDIRILEAACETAYKVLEVANRPAAPAQEWLIYQDRLSHSRAELAEARRALEQR